MPDTASPSTSRTFCYSVSAWRDPNSYLRVLEAIAKRNFTPVQVHCSTDTVEQDLIAIDFQLRNIGDDDARRILNELHGRPCVKDALMCEKADMLV